MNSQKWIIRCVLLALLCLLVLPSSDTWAKENQEGIEVPIIMYHSLKKNGRDPWTLHPDAFRQDLQYLQENGYQSILLTDLVDYMEDDIPLPEKPIILSFDDCHYNNLVYAMPLLEEFDMRMVLSIIGSSSQQYSEVEDLNPEYAHLSWAQLCEMQDTGRVELANHTWNLHSNVKGGRHGCCRMSGENLESYRQVLADDVSKLQSTLLEQCGIQPIGFTYPFGNRCPEALELLKELGFKVTLSCYEGMNYVSRENPDSLYDMHRINRTPQKSVQSILQNLKQKKK